MTIHWQNVTTVLPSAGYCWQWHGQFGIAVSARIFQRMQPESGSQGVSESLKANAGVSV